LDQQEIEKHLLYGDSQSFNTARKIYHEGSHALPYATLQLAKRLTDPIEGNTQVIGMSEGKRAVYGRTWGSSVSGVKEIYVHYDVQGEDGDYIPCRVAGNMEGCYAAQGGLLVEGHGALEYTYNILTGNKNQFSLYGFSENEALKMYRCKHDCPYPEYEKFYKYYGILDFGDVWIEAAFEGKNTKFGASKFDHGNVDFSSMTMAGRAEAIKRATVYMNVFTQVYRILQEFAIDSCKNDCSGDSCHTAVEQWDSAVAVCK
jgi:hypothetical protein